MDTSIELSCHILNLDLYSSVEFHSCNHSGIFKTAMRINMKHKLFAVMKNEKKIGYHLILNTCNFLLEWPDGLKFTTYIRQMWIDMSNCQFVCCTFFKLLLQFASTSISCILFRILEICRMQVISFRFTLRKVLTCAEKSVQCSFPACVWIWISCIVIALLETFLLLHLWL